MPEGDGTRVVWGLDADMGAGPVGRWVGAAYDRGLARLQAVVAD